MVNQEKIWDWKHMLSYEMRIGQWEIEPNDWTEKDVQKGKRLNWKKMPKKEKIEMRKLKMVYLFINLPI